MYAYFLLLLIVNGKPAFQKHPNAEAVCKAYFANAGSVVYGVKTDIEDSEHDLLECGIPVVVDPPKPASYTEYPIGKAQ